MQERWKSIPRLPLIVLLVFTPYLYAQESYVPDGEWRSCRDWVRTSTLPNCMCLRTPDEEFRVNCDQVVFPTDFPNLPFRQPIISFSQRNVCTQNIPPQAFIASGVGLKELDLSHNWLRRLSEKSLDGLVETLEILDLSYNLLGDQLNPIFSTAEFRKLPRLKSLSLDHNLLAHIDGGILDGCLSLQELHLAENELGSVPTSSLKGPKAMRLLDLGFNQIEELKVDDFNPQPSLVTLNLTQNKIHVIQGNAFRGMTNLKGLDLSWNRLHRLNSDPFNGLASIELIDLSNNFLSQIPATALKILSETLKELRLSANLIQTLDGSGLKGLKHLEILDLSRNRISEIPRGFFSGMTRLTHLDLGVNQLRAVPGSTFEGLKNLRSLSLKDNNLLTYPASALDSLHALTSLRLDYNRISAINPSRKMNLTFLSLSHNLVRDIPSDTFSSFPSLEFLDLRGNLIERMDTVQLPASLSTLRLGLNSLATIPRFSLPVLQVLDLATNAVPALLPHNFVLLPLLQELDVSGNVIVEVAENAFDGMRSLEKLDLSRNSLVVLPNIRNLLELKEVNFSRNGLKEVGRLTDMAELEVVDLSRNAITNLGRNIFDNTTSLSRLLLNGNKLNSFRGFEGTFDQLKEIDLSGNQITYVYPNTFENLEELWDLELGGNRFTFFPTEFLRNCRSIRSIGLSRNQIKSLNEMNFSNFPHLRRLDLSENGIEFLQQNTFLNSSQLQRLNLSSNKLENIDPNLFHGLSRLELDLSNNYLSALPTSLFERGQVQKLHKINLSKNTFREIPWEALQKQYFFLEELNMSENGIREVPSNLNILVNVKDLDLSRNPLTPSSLKTLLNEPKTARRLNLAHTGLTGLPVLEMPFLRHLNISGNPVQDIDQAVFGRTTLLRTLLLAKSSLYSVEGKLPPSLTTLDLSGSPMTAISGNMFPSGLTSLILNDLEGLTKVEKSTLHLRHLNRLELTNCPKLGYLDIRGLLTNLHYLEHFDFEVKDHQIVDQIHPGLNARVQTIGLRGRRIRSISTGAFAGLTSPRVRISLTNTSLTLLPSILVPVPMSSSIVLDISGSKISNLSPPFLSETIRLEGLSPVCDCNALALVKYIQSIENDVTCSGPRSLEGARVLDLNPANLICESGSTTSTTPIPIVSSTLSTTHIPDDIIWSLPPSPPRKPGKKGVTSGDKSGRRQETSTVKTNVAAEINNMDNLVIAVVGGVIAGIVLLFAVVFCLVRGCRCRSGRDEGRDYPMPAGSVMSVPAYVPASKCTCPHNKEEPPRLQMIPANYATATMRSHGKMLSLPPPGGHPHGQGGIYALHPNANGTYSTMTMGQAQALSNYHSGYNTVRQQQHQQQMMQHQQQQIYGSLPYFVQDDFERR